MVVGVGGCGCVVGGEYGRGMYTFMRGRKLVGLSAGVALASFYLTGGDLGTDNIGCLGVLDARCV